MWPMVIGALLFAIGVLFGFGISHASFKLILEGDESPFDDYNRSYSSIKEKEHNAV
jgi:hypothetical protein